MPPIIISIDVEADGPAPTTSSMLQLGAVARISASMLGKFSVNILPRPEGTPNPDTAKWLRENGVAERVAVDAVGPRAAMAMFADWLRDLTSGGRKIRFVARPAAFDWMWLVT